MSLLCIWFGILLCACSKETQGSDSVSSDKMIVDIYNDFAVKENVKSMALIYLDEDEIPELMILRNGAYELYTVEGENVQAILAQNLAIQLSAYGPRHDFEDSDELMFYWFEYVPYKGLIRTHGGNEEERHDYYLRYADGELEIQMEAMSREYEWHTYEGKQEISREEFTEKIALAGYDMLIPCGYLYPSVMEAYENMGRRTDTKQIWKDFVEGKADALYCIEAIEDIPEDGFVMRSFDELYEMTTGDELWGKLEYTDYDNDEEEELIICGYMGSRMFFDIIGDTVYLQLCTGSTTDNASVAEINNKRVIQRTDLLHKGRKYYRIMKYDACGCLVDWFWLYASYEGDTYTEKDVFEYDNTIISMSEFERRVKNIQRVDTETEKSFESKYHIESENKIYFREYSKNSILEKSKDGNYYEIKDMPKAFVELNENGELTRLFEDDGYGSIYLFDGNLYSQCIKENGKSKVYSCDLNGKNRREWESEEILEQAENGVLICKTGNEGLAIIDGSGERVIVEESIQYQGCYDTTIYYAEKNDKTIDLYSMDVEGKGENVSCTFEFEKDINIVAFDVCGNYFAFAAGEYIDGKEYRNGVIILCKKDGSEVKRFYSDSLKFSFYNEGIKTAFLYEEDETVKWEVLGKEMYYETFEHIYEYRILDTNHSISGYLLHTDDEKTYLYEFEYDELCKKIKGLNKYKSDFMEISNAEIIGNLLFFDIVLEESETDNYRKHIATFGYVKNLSTREIIQLYEY